MALPAPLEFHADHLPECLNCMLLLESLIVLVQLPIWPLIGDCEIARAVRVENVYCTLDCEIVFGTHWEMAILLETREEENNLRVECLQGWRGNGIVSRKLAWERQELLMGE